MRIALVHDYIGEFGGAERVLLALSEIWPDAPIYTAFSKKGETLNRLAGRDIRTSWAQNIPGFSNGLYSPLRFLAPLIWGSFVRQLADYDVIISSASWYVTKGFGARPSPIEICYCHTPPRYLYGYQTSINANWLTKIYAAVVNPFMRWYDFNAAQRVDYFIANSEEIKSRIKKFYNRDAIVIYPPVEINSKYEARKDCNASRAKHKNYYLTVARVVGGKGLDLAIEAANRVGFPLKIVGTGNSKLYDGLKKKAGENIEFLGFVEDDKLAQLYNNAKAFLALSRDEDFGITPVEAMQAGTPVIAYGGGGYLETVVEGKTGVFFKDYSAGGLIDAIKRFEKIEIKSEDCIKQGEKFSKERFKKEILDFVSSKLT